MECQSALMSTTFLGSLNRNRVPKYWKYVSMWIEHLFFLQWLYGNLCLSHWTQPSNFRNQLLCRHLSGLYFNVLFLRNSCDIALPGSSNGQTNSNESCLLYAGDGAKCASPKFNGKRNLCPSTSHWIINVLLFVSVPTVTVQKSFLV